MNSSESNPPSPANPAVSRRTFLASGSFCAGALVVGKGLWHEPRTAKLEHLHLASAKIAASRQMRVVQLSDLHIRHFSSFHLSVARLIERLSPDLILLTGDYVDRERNLSAVGEFLSHLSAPHGIYAVQGNWEYWARIEGESLRQAFARWGVTLLINERFDLRIRNTPVSILGLDYPSAADALKKLQRQADPARLNLLLSHVPAFNHELLDGRLDLLLAGHTHGGQVRLPGVTPFYLPRFSEPFVSGLYQVGPGTPLYVNRGLGTSLLPVRFLCPPEVTLFTLGAKTA
ncbi:metallophosphoesterase [Geoalkalibacter halelectricus]|uniref:Metallophosphoesterase n=1 Tax=Geoalkalibacter halelectricus TaxID=2847045 RepID=A0ABY5ZSD9_9BACT|nr:metallophosphoesterase [Geoalkalibacter halelectricus]MDO3377378.1 metallophosphoesterase [Geoalkalibacter halelectricus]UWZ80857.1 metallophosphoesterase [Geoalkalibacter halelectricus]